MVPRFNQVLPGRLSEIPDDIRNLPNQAMLGATARETGCGVQLLVALT
jgi:hypothetical protein